MERIAITGSHGFIGNHLSERFNSEELTKVERDKYPPLNVRIVFDLSAYGNLYDQKDIKETYKTNLWRVIDILGREPKSKFIFTSSSSVMLPKQTAYSASKKAMEEVVSIFAEEQGIRACIVRPFSITGIGEQKGHLIPKLIDSAINGTEMDFVPRPVHDFLDVDDFVDALLTIKEKGSFNGEIYQIGSGIEYSNMEVLRIVSDVVGSEPNISLVESLRNYDTTHWRSNNERIASLGWKPKKTLVQSIKEQVKYARKSN